MNCREMRNIPTLKDSLILRAGEKGLDHSIRWIYFADCLQCVQKEYRMEDYIHGNEFVVFTNRTLTQDSPMFLELIERMEEANISAIGINEGQISTELIHYCNEKELPLFELPEVFPLVDLSQILCERLVLEQTRQNSRSQLFSSLLDARLLHKESVLSQARALGIQLSGQFQVIEFCYENGESEILFRQIENEFLDSLLLKQVGSILVLAQHVEKEVLQRIVGSFQEKIYVGIGNKVDALEEIKNSRNQASIAIRVGKISKKEESIFYYQEMGLYTLISKISDETYISDFVEEHLGKLIRVDQVNDSSLLETLEIYINHSCNAKKCAEDMFIHRNTLNYRLEKIQDILGVDLNDFDSIILLKLSILMYRIVQSA
ncbi:MAG: PucR family transcriptional regulator ligand-binding domain-containing protein [Bacillota bacterium]|nr:PucR family transcriptional regulator ligand-binding domain-containing protein [Bacillota bacterium]